MIPPEITEMTHGAMQVHWSNGDDVSRMRQIIRHGDGTYRTGDAEHATYSTNRDDAYVFHGHGPTPADGEENSIFEILPAEDAATTVRRVPDAIAEFDRYAMQRQFDGHDGGRQAYHEYSLIIRYANGQWFKAYGVRTAFREEAKIFSTYGVTGVAEEDCGEIAEILPRESDAGAIPAWANAPAAADGTPIKRKLVPVYFNSEFVKLFGVAPKNEFVRGWILKQTKKMPPEDCDTMDKLEDWLQALPSAQVKAPAKSAPRLSIRIDFSGTESGTCHYSGPTSGSAEFIFSEEELRDWVTEALENREGMDGVLDSARAIISDEAFDRTDPNMELNMDDVSYDRLEASDGGGDDYDYNHSVLRPKLEEWIRANMPDEARLLFGGAEPTEPPEAIF